MGFDYHLTLDFEMANYGEGWLPVQAVSGYGKYQHGHGDVPNPRIHAAGFALTATAHMMTNRHTTFILN